MSIELLFRAPEMADSIILVDPLRSMIRFARSKEKLECALSVFENLPFKDSSVGAAMAGFSIRDARSLLHAFREIARLLRDDGKLLVVDLSKPDSDAKSSLISFYWHVIAPFIALVSSGKLGLRFGALSRTFQRLPKNSEFIKLAKRAGFTVTKARYSMLGGACVILFRKEPQDPGFRTHPD
jgi:demethylmenaquinone methyltransferase/2-methoxy-6-polyprenyl-1,4-benzoquinol methylase